MIKVLAILFLIYNTAFASQFGTLKKNEVNVRNGPGEEYQIIRKFTKAGLPVQIVHKLDNWYLIKDFEDETGWVRVNAVSFGIKNGMVLENNTAVCRLPVSGTEKCNTIAILKQEVIVSIKACGEKWCRIIIDKSTTGWIEKNKIWGV